MIPTGLVSALVGASQNIWAGTIALTALVAGTALGAFLKGLPAMTQTKADSDASLRGDLLARIERLEERSGEQDKLLAACEARDSANRGKIERVTFCARVLAEELPIENRVRRQVDAMLGGNWTVPPTPPEMAAMVAKLDDTP